MGSLAGLASALGLLGFRWLRPTARSGSNLILITVDTLRADRLGVYGNAFARTHNIDRLAREGTLFTEATTPMPRTTPALASLLTGLWPHHHGSREVGRSMKRLPTLATVLGRHGYATLGVSANLAAGRSQNLDLGFVRFADRADLKGERAEEVSSRALELVRAAPAGAPVFLWAHYVDPHFPYTPPLGWHYQPRGDACHHLAARAAKHKLSLGRIHTDWHGLAERALGDCRAMYDAEVDYVDFAIGRLLGGLRRLGRLDHAVVVFTADHGENFGEDGLYYEHGPSLHDASLRVPLIVAGVGPAGRIDRGVARLEDLMPTLLSLLGVAREDWPAMDGQDLSLRFAPWTPTPPREPMAFAEAGNDLDLESYHRLCTGYRSAMRCLNGPRFSLCDASGVPLKLFDHLADPERTRDVGAAYPEELAALEQARLRWPVEEGRDRAVRTGRFKLVASPRLEGGYSTRLFDLAADPEEVQDVSARHPRETARLRTALDRWAAGISGSGTAEHSPEQIEQLRALGYVE